jgi:hypothetical protein
MSSSPSYGDTAPLNESGELWSRAASFSGSVPTGLCIGFEAETANHRTRYGSGCWPSTKCGAATLVRTCRTKAIEECRAPRDAARGHACLTRPGRAHRDKHRLVA